MLLLNTMITPAPSKIEVNRNETSAKLSSIRKKEVLFGPRVASKK